MSASENIEDNSPYAFLFSMSISCLQFVFRAFHILFLLSLSSTMGRKKHSVLHGQTKLSTSFVLATTDSHALANTLVQSIDTSTSIVADHVPLVDTSASTVTEHVPSADTSDLIVTEPVPSVDTSTSIVIEHAIS